jgi:hypothetical protein
MKKTILKLTLVILTVVVIILSLGISVAAAGNGTGKGSACPVLATTLTPEEINWLTYIREEEKLARDIYDVLYTKWKLRIFDNISDSEQNHMDSILKLLNKYGVEDPALGQGKFDNEHLQDIYDELYTRGNISLIEALKVGVDIELLDIDDLVLALGATDKTDLETVYNNLMEGSKRHLIAFQSNLEKQEVIYLSQP